MKTYHQTLMFGLAVLAAPLSACLATPEQCQGCIKALADGGPSVVSDAPVERGATGGTGLGGDMGTGGILGSGDMGTGGVGSGGMGTAGVGSGGLGTGGTGSGGTGTGGTGSGGTGTGGAGTGGTGTGGTGSGGRGTGGAGTGGTGTGGLGGSTPGTGGAGVGGMGTGGMGTGGSATGGGGTGPDPDLVLWYKFDESSGTVAADAAMFGGTAQNGMLMTVGNGGTSSFSTTARVGTNALSLTPSTNLSTASGVFVVAPSLQTLAPTALTIAVWVNLPVNTATQAWQRIFDFGSGRPSTRDMYLTARAGDAPNTPVRFVITTTGHTGTAEQRLDGTMTLSTNAWHHIAVVLPAGATYTGTLYIDGVAVATNPAMTLHPTDLGASTQNWIGRSQFSGDPFFNGLLDDFRVYRRALTAAEITALFVAVR